MAKRIKPPMSADEVDAMFRAWERMEDNLIVLVVWRNETTSRRKARAIQRVIDKKYKLYKSRGLRIGGDLAWSISPRSWDASAIQRRRQKPKTMECSSGGENGWE